MDNLTINKFKLGRKAGSCKIDFDWLIPAGELAVCSVEIPEAPHDDLIKALDKLIYLVIESHGLETDGWNDLGHVTGVTFKQAEPNTWGITLTAQKPVTSEGLDASAVVTTPYLSSDFLVSDQPLIRELIEEIKACLEGKRLNGNLFRQGDLLSLDAEEDVAA